MVKMGVLALLGTAAFLLVATDAVPPEAPAGFDSLTNGMTDQPQFDLDRATFDEREELGDGLGPTYNAQSCGECHQNPVSGAGSQISEFRAGAFDGLHFTDHPGGSLINDRAIDASLQERALGSDNVRVFRMSLSVLGDGFIEALSDDTIGALAANQPASMRGRVIKVPVGEAGGALRVARFGWKNQHASLLSFAADAYLNEMGITSPLQPTENTSNGDSVAAFDTVADPEDAATPTEPNGKDIEAFTRFMRASKVPPRDLVAAATGDAIAGAAIFSSLGCNTCHTTTLVTAPAGTSVNGGTFVIPAALGGKKIHPYGDFLLHDVGTGDGIIQNGGPATRNLLRTPPLWGLRSRDRLMHDGLSLSRNDAILRHAGQASRVIDGYRHLSLQDKNRLVAFLNSL
ncbi:MAG: di-heme oxidoredictase family protein [Acidobacteriota bacterium]